MMPDYEEVAAKAKRGETLTGEEKWILWKRVLETGASLCWVLALGVLLVIFWLFLSHWK